jgi:hypothetical protein
LTTAIVVIFIIWAWTSDWRIAWCSTFTIAWTATSWIWRWSWSWTWARSTWRSVTSSISFDSYVTCFTLYENK